MIACDTAARPLLTVGVEPDFIVATDSSRANAAHLSSLPASRAWLVGEGSLHPSAFTHFDGRTFVFRVADHHPWPWLRSIGLDCAVLDTWGSVATSALSLAIAMGCNPIVFMGADFAFTGGRPYCRGTSFEPVWAAWSGGGATPDAIWTHLVERWPAEYETDSSGETVRTAPHLISFRDWIVDRTCGQRDRRFVNATGAGLLAGPAIEQQAASSTLAGAESLDRALLHQVIQAAHRSRHRSLGTLLEARHDPAGRGDQAAVQSWLEFAAPAGHAIRHRECAAVARVPGLGTCPCVPHDREPVIVSPTLDICIATCDIVGPIRNGGIGTAYYNTGARAGAGGPSRHRALRARLVLRERTIAALAGRLRARRHHLRAAAGCRLVSGTQRDQDVVRRLLLAEDARLRHRALSTNGAGSGFYTALAKRQGLCLEEPSCAWARTARCCGTSKA